MESPVFPGFFIGRPAFTILGGVDRLNYSLLMHHNAKGLGVLGTEAGPIYCIFTTVVNYGAGERIYSTAIDRV